MNPILREKDLQSFIIEFVANLEFWPEKIKAEMRSKFLKIEKKKTSEKAYQRFSMFLTSELA